MRVSKDGRSPRFLAGSRRRARDLGPSGDWHFVDRTKSKLEIGENGRFVGINFEEISAAQMRDSLLSS